MRQVKSCGVLVFRREPRSFLLLKHASRFDLPKGHVEEGETELVCALRELAEETGIAAEQVELVEGFRFETSYQTRSKRFRGELVEKTLVIFLGELRGAGTKVTPTEHAGHVWMPWRPPHAIQPATIDPLLAEVERWFASTA